MLDASAFRLLLLILTGWLDRRERDALAYLTEENRVLRPQLGGRRLRLTDDDRRRLAARAYRLSRRAVWEIATIVTPDTLLRWHRPLVARKWTYARTRSSRREVLLEIQRLVGRMADENATWGYTRIQGALKNLGHRVGRSTIARIVKARGVSPVPGRPTSWEIFLRAHWSAIAGADFFTTEVWTWRGLTTYYPVFVLDLASRRVRVLGSTPYPDEMFMRPIGRSLTFVEEGSRRVLIGDRDATWTDGILEQLREAGVRIVRTRYQAAERECLRRTLRALDQAGLRSCRSVSAISGARSPSTSSTIHRERIHQGLANELTDGVASRGAGRVYRRPRLGGLLNDYARAA